MTDYEPQHKAPKPARVRILAAVAVVMFGAGFLVEHGLHQAFQPHQETQAATQTVTKAPQACGKALKQADEVLAAAGEFGTYIKDLSTASGGLHDMTADGSALGNHDGKHYRTTVDFLAELDTLRGRYEQAAHTCREAGQTGDGHEH